MEKNEIVGALEDLREQCNGLELSIRHNREEAVDSVKSCFEDVDSESDNLAGQVEDLLSEVKGMDDDMCCEPEALLVRQVTFINHKEIIVTYRCKYCEAGYDKSFVLTKESEV